MQQVRTVFEKLRAEDPAIWHVVDASMTLDEVTEKVSSLSYSTDVTHCSFGAWRVWQTQGTEFV
jgi:hypothetical protein